MIEPRNQCPWDCRVIWSELPSFLDPYWKENIFLWFVILLNILEKAGNLWTTQTSLHRIDCTAAVLLPMLDDRKFRTRYEGPWNPNKDYNPVLQYVTFKCPAMNGDGATWSWKEKLHFNYKTFRALPIAPSTDPEGQKLGFQRNFGRHFLWVTNRRLCYIWLRPLISSLCS